MENNETIEPVVKQKSNKGLIIIVILILIVLGLSGYLVYDKFTAKEETKANEVKETKTNEESKDDTTSNDNNTSSQITETDEDIVKRLFIKDYLQKPEAEKLLDYRIDKVEILEGQVRQSVIDMGYKETDILATVTYSVKVNDVNTSAWNAGNGEGYDGQWILRKSNCIMIRDGKLTVTGTSF